MYHESPHKIVKGIAKCLHNVLTQLSFVEKFLYESMETNRLKNGLLKTPYPNNCKRSSTKYVRDIFRKTNVLIVARLDIAFFFLSIYLVYRESGFKNTSLFSEIVPKTFSGYPIYKPVYSFARENKYLGFARRDYHPIILQKFDIFSGQ